MIIPTCLWVWGGWGCTLPLLERFTLYILACLGRWGWGVPPIMPPNHAKPTKHACDMHVGVEWVLECLCMVVV